MKNTPVLEWPIGGALAIGEADNVAQTQGSATLDSKDKFTITDANATLSIATATGFVKGSVRDSTSKSILLQGVVFQNQATVRGPVLSAAHSGSLELDAK